MSSILENILVIIKKHDAFQAKKLSAHFEMADNSLFEDANVLLPNLLSCYSISLEDATRSYLSLCRDMLKCQLYFKRHNRYPVYSENDLDSLYNDSNKMKVYMSGLALSQFLWPHHYATFDFFKKTCEEQLQSSSSYMEIGVGHGIYAYTAISHLGLGANVKLIDISATSKEMTKSLIEKNLKTMANIEYAISDFKVFSTKRLFDFVCMGEILEHVSTPDMFLEKVRGFISPNGHLFVSTCANSPAIDHVYHFETIEGIQTLIRKSGFSIVDERILPSERVSNEDAELNKIPVNYSALMELL